jgi:hypothetical protein
MPSLSRGAYTRTGEGASYKWWHCDGSQIRQVQSYLPEAEPYSTYSVFYIDGFGFWVLKGDAINPSPNETWQPLHFEHPPDGNYSSYLCNVAPHRRVACRRRDQQWLKMLLPDIYYEGAPETAYPQYGGLKGELAIFLALVAFAIHPDDLLQWLPVMFTGRAWRTQGPRNRHGSKSGRLLH